MIPEDKLAEYKKLVGAATPGPWNAFDDLSNAYWKYRDAVFNERNVVVLATIKTPAFDGCGYLDEEI